MPVHKTIDTTPDKISEGYERRAFHLENLMITVCDFTGGPADEPDSPHSHPHEQITYVAVGELYFFIGNEKHIIGTGDVVTIPSGIPHCIQTISPHVRLIDSFTPLRDDFLKK
jgi:quercetin dioxygenase-like cupin family protein